MKIESSFGFYGILTNPVVGYGELARIMVELGVRFIQLRMKETPHREVLETARVLRQIISGESGSAGLAALLALFESDSLAEARLRLGLDESSRVLLFNTEGDTDPDNFKSIVAGG